MYIPLRLTKKILDKHVKDLYIFRFSHFLSKSSTFLSRDYVEGFLFLNKTGKPESVLIVEKATRRISALILLYSPRREYKDASIVILTSRLVKLDIAQIAKLISSIIAMKTKQSGLFCIRTTVLESEEDQKKILENIGFEPEVRLKEQAYHDGRYEDVIAYTYFGGK